MPTLTAECPKDNVCDDVMGWGVKPSERSESNVAAAVWTDDIRHAHFKATRALRVNSGKKCAIRWAERVREQYEPATASHPCISLAHPTSTGKCGSPFVLQGSRSVEE